VFFCFEKARIITILAFYL